MDAAAIEPERAGADLALLARGEAELERVAAALRRENVRALPLAVDIADADAVLTAIERPITELGRALPLEPP